MHHRGKRAFDHHVRKVSRSLKLRDPNSQILPHPKVFRSIVCETDSVCKSMLRDRSKTRSIGAAIRVSSWIVGMVYTTEISSSACSERPGSLPSNLFNALRYARVAATIISVFAA